MCAQKLKQDSTVGASAPLLASMACLAVVALNATSGMAAQPTHFWQDPVVTYTNGVRLASSTPLRSHNMYWQCDPERRGYCEGQESGSLLRPFSAGKGACGYRQQLYHPAPAAVRNDVYSDGLAGIEQTDGERLGSIPNGFGMGGFSRGPLPVVQAPLQPGR